MEQHIFQGPGSPRLDHFIQQLHPELPAGLLHKYLRQNKIKLNGKKQAFSTRLTYGDTICLYLPAEKETTQATQLKILYEDENLLAVDKPAGLLSADEKQEGRENLLSQAQHYVLYGHGRPLPTSAQTNPSFDLPALCHRLDTGTSGVVLIAKTQPMLAFTTHLIRQHQLQKQYVGITIGHPAPPLATLNGYLVKNAHSGTVRIVSSKSENAKPVTTKYETIATSGQLALLRLWAITGRTHQLRAHLASIGTPILGDSKYGHNDVNRALKCRYQCLCAQQVRFPTLQGDFAAYSNLTIQCEPPWYVEQIINEKLHY